MHQFPLPDNIYPIQYYIRNLVPDRVLHRPAFPTFNILFSSLYPSFYSCKMRIYKYWILYPRSHVDLRVATKILRRFYTLLGNNRFLSSDARFLALQIDSLTIPSPENWLFESSLQLWWICSLLYHANTMSILKRIKIFSKMYCREKKSGLVLTATTNRLFNDIIKDFFVHFIYWQASN